jgi:hypothetical protein
MALVDTAFYLLRANPKLRAPYSGVVHLQKYPHAPSIVLDTPVRPQFRGEACRRAALLSHSR